jgi:ABC-type transport system substrate-binding protein
MGYNNPEVDRLNKAAQVERSAQKRRDLYVQAQRLILSDGPFVTLGYPHRAFGARAGVQGLVVGPLGDDVMRGVKIG